MSDDQNNPNAMHELKTPEPTESVVRSMPLLEDAERLATQLEQKVFEIDRRRQSIREELERLDALHKLVAGSSPAPCSPAHVRFELRTEQGNVATIKGDPNMPEATRKALAAMIDAAVTAANAGKLKAPENDQAHPTAARASVGGTENL